MIDWEDVDIGCGPADVGSLIAGCIPNLDPDTEQVLLRHYHRVLLEHDVSGFGFDTCYEAYRRCMVERFVQGVLSGTLHDLSTASPKDIAFATAMGSRFVAAAERLNLREFVSTPS